ncbi:hypothetical protein ACQCU3_00340 [Bacillus altitudinis]|uniref:hypothetical protein n=1 Tax=Bacillus TaxID=1386 RepID=UPI0011E8FA21|nr:MULTISPECIES: hypothetical protein [Bacillus]MBR0600989.1 hypothetical protein [Bacillus safensis]TYS29931.1 hypothetical protein FZC69_02660 [Bacillus altitudinis]
MGNDIIKLAFDQATGFRSPAKQENFVHQIDSNYIQERQTSEKGVEVQMSNSNHLFDEIKADMREREQRTRSEIKEREERFEKQMSQFATEAEKREERFINENKEREQRMLAKIDDLSIQIRENAKHTEAMKTQNFWGNIAMFVGLVAIIITLFINN